MLTSRRRFRRALSRLLKAPLGFRGYFDLYNIPFRYICLFDFTEKRSPLQPGGMNRGPNIFDYLEDQHIRYYVSAPEKPEQANLQALRRDLQTERIDFAFLYWPGLDGLLHRVGNQSPQVPAKLRGYEQWIAELLQVATEHYSEVRLYVFGDHGMANCTEVLDLRQAVEALPCRFARDYVAVYDSTMARFWFFQESARQQVTRCLQSQRLGRIVPDAELEQMGALFPDRYFGELVFLVQEGVLIAPSHMGERPICAMHGYHPHDPQSYAALCTNQPALPEDVTAIPHMFRLMKQDADLARISNSPVLPSSVAETADGLVGSN
jgi:hypothetical protein